MEGTIEQQIFNERKKKEDSIERYTEELKEAKRKGRLDETQEGKTLTKLGFEPLSKKIQEYFDSELKNKSVNIRNTIMNMSDNSEVIAYIVLTSVISILHKNKNLTVLSASKSIFNNLYDNLMFDRLKTNDPKLYSYLTNTYKRASSKRKKELIEKHTQNLKTLKTNEQEIILIGSKLLEIFDKSSAGIIQILDRKVGKKTLRIVEPTIQCIEILMKSKSINSILSTANMLPMIVKPKDWEEIDKGGYLTHQIPLIKEKYKKHIKKNEINLSRTMEVVNYLQQQPFRINTRIVDIIKEIFYENKMDLTFNKKYPKLIGGLPCSKSFQIKDLIHVSEYGELEQGSDFKLKNKEDFFKFNRDREDIQIYLDGEAGNRLNLKYALIVVEQMKEFDKFYYVYQLDYRGRIYPHQNYLNPQSSKQIKCMLEPAEGIKLDENGIYWLKIHTSNEFGNDKLSFEGRLKWFEDNDIMIQEIGRDPLSNLRNWIYADNPFGFLDACLKYIDHLDGKLVNLGMGLDATCSGIQMYSGMMLDKNGALAVNVIGDSRNDIYQEVANRVEELLRLKEYPKTLTFGTKDGEQKTVSTHIEAESLKGNITRSLCKRNTMTVPYNVSKHGMFEQLLDEFNKLKMKDKVFWQGDEWVAVKVLTELNYRAIYEIIRGAKLGKDYLKECVLNRIKIPYFRTPIFDLPVYQPSYKQKGKRVKTNLGTLRFYENTNEVNRMKMGNSIAPNVIHSIDAVLLYLVVEKLRDKEKFIWVIHDNFIVNPNDGYLVQEAYRESYIELMELNPIEFIGKQLNAEVKLEKVNTLDLKEVKKSKYIIS